MKVKQTFIAIASVLFVFLYCPHAAAQQSTIHNSLRDAKVQHDDISGKVLADESFGRRALQALDGVAPQVGIFLTGAFALIPSLSQYETPIALRFTSYLDVMAWNCVAVYSEAYKDALTKERPAVIVGNMDMYSTQNRAECGAHSFAAYIALSFPEAYADYVDAVGTIGISIEETPTEVLDCSDAECLMALANGENFNPTIMGQIVAKQVYDYSIADGFNQLGTDGGCTVNCRAYSDVTGYTPVNCPYTKEGVPFESRWTPLLEDNGKGFLYLQEHVTPHIGKTAAFRYLPESDRTDRVAPSPGYSIMLQEEAQAVIDIMTDLDDERKIEVEAFDDKLTVAIAIVNSLFAKLIGDDYNDDEFGGDVPVAYERFVHFLTGYTATEYDSLIIAWKEKVNYDLVRPTSVIKKFDGDITTWAPGGIQTFPAKDFEAYIRVMPHSEYVSGSACLFQALEEYVLGYMDEIGLSTTFPVTFQPVPAGASKVEPGTVPSVDVQLMYEDIESMAAAGSQSRLNGGMHFTASVEGAKAVCAGIGYEVIEKHFDLLGWSGEMP